MGHALKMSTDVFGPVSDFVSELFGLVGGCVEDKLSIILEKVTAIEEKIEKSSDAYEQITTKLDQLYKEIMG